MIKCLKDVHLQFSSDEYHYIHCMCMYTCMHPSVPTTPIRSWFCNLVDTNKSCALLCNAKGVGAPD